MYSTAIVRGHMAGGASKEAAESLAHQVVSILQQVQDFLGGSPMTSSTRSPKEKAAVAAAAQCASQRNFRYPNISTGGLTMQEQNTPIRPTNLTNLAEFPAFATV